uniref:Uncharacterized protein n=1 Tax=Sus scrofa TaxID=9823 RepID=A0A4X1TKH7_PIG
MCCGMVAVSCPPLSHFTAQITYLSHVTETHTRKREFLTLQLLGSSLPVICLYVKTRKSSLLVKWIIRVLLILPSKPAPASVILRRTWSFLSLMKRTSMWQWCVGVRTQRTLLWSSSWSPHVCWGTALLTLIAGLLTIF